MRYASEVASIFSSFLFFFFFFIRGNVTTERKKGKKGRKVKRDGTTDNVKSNLWKTAVSPPSFSLLLHVQTAPVSDTVQQATALTFSASRSLVSATSMARHYAEITPGDIAILFSSQIGFVALDITFRSNFVISDAFAPRPFLGVISVAILRSAWNRSFISRRRKRVATIVNWDERYEMLVTFEELLRWFKRDGREGKIKSVLLKGTWRARGEREKKLSSIFVESFSNMKSRLEWFLQIIGLFLSLSLSLLNWTLGGC